MLSMGPSPLAVLMETANLSPEELDRIAKQYGWDKTWAYLKELGQNIEYYPSGTGAVMKELQGTADAGAVRKALTEKLG